ncbi:AAA family ATPase [Aliarcobacter butzleri]|uniref:AAA family ATPase n=3 Tax=Aliarcobacter butzleri TaxID=28197 RepID=UPI00344BCBC3
MELVYLWVEKDKNIEKQGFNFSPNFDVKFTPVYEDEQLSDKSELKITPKENPLKDFFGDNINITAIVGENGSGKTSILDQIMDNNSSGIIVYFHKNELKCYTRYKIQIVTNLEFEKITKNYQHFHSNDDILKVDKITNILEYSSTKNDFCNMNKGLAKDGLSKLDISKYSKNISALIIKHFNKLNNEIFQKVAIKIDSLEKEDKYSLEKKLLKYFIENDEKKKYSDINFNDESFCAKVIEDYKLSEYILFLNSISKVLNGDYIDFNNLNLDDNQLILLSKLISNSFLSIELTDTKNRDLFSFSQGERKKIIEKLILLECFNDGENRLILLDEPDNTLHPNWQKEYINLLVTLLKDKKYIHIIITSHSPFLISDLPKENVIFLEKGKQVYPFEDGKQTFGANIHTLLSHGFFMKDGLMGEFAKDKIQSIIKYHEDIEKKEILETDTIEYKTKKQKEFWQIQSIIGDDYLKQVIKNHLVEIEKIVLGNDEAKEEEIKRLEAQIEQLRN